MLNSPSPRRIRIGAELRWLRDAAGLSGEQVAAELGWSQAKVSRIEVGRTAFTVKDVASLLALYGVAQDDVRAELLAATAEDAGEAAWIVRADANVQRQAPMAGLGVVTERVRQYQPVMVPGLLQTREYAWYLARAVGASDPDAAADGQMRRQEALSHPSGPRYEVVLDARALLLRTGPVELVRDQASSLAERAMRPKMMVRVIPIGGLSSVVGTVGFAIYDFRSSDSPSVTWVEAPTGDAYFVAPADLARYSSIFGQAQAIALSAEDSVSYLRWLSEDIDRFMIEPRIAGNSGSAD